MRVNSVNGYFYKGALESVDLIFENLIKENFWIWQKDFLKKLFGWGDSGVAVFVVGIIMGSSLIVLNIIRHLKRFQI